MTDDVQGGYITYANNDSGKMAYEDIYNAKLCPEHNSLYMMFGSYAEHGVRRMVKGTRIAFVFFYSVETNFQQLLYIWGNRPEQCRLCFRTFLNKKTLAAHAKSCPKEVLFSRYKLEVDNKKDEEKQVLSVRGTTWTKEQRLEMLHNKICLGCNKYLRTTRNLLKHRKSCKGPNYQKSSEKEGEEKTEEQR